MRFVDDVILDLLRDAVPPLDGHDRVHHGFVPVDSTDATVITAVLPYLFYASSVGDDSNRRVTGVNGRRSVFFQVTYVGEDPAQAKWAGEHARAALADRVIPIPDRKSWRVLLGESQRIRRDDDAARPDGSPLYYGVDLYSVAVTRQPHE